MVESETTLKLCVVVPAGFVYVPPLHAQWPAGMLLETTLVAEPDEIATVDAVAVCGSPIFPEPGVVSDVVSPGFRMVCEVVTVLSAAVPVLLSEVKAPEDGAVLPIAVGLDKSDEKPVPLTVPLAESVVNAPVPAVVDPIEPGEAKVAPPRVAALIVALQPNPDPPV